MMLLMASLGLLLAFEAPLTDTPAQVAVTGPQEPLGSVSASLLPELPDLDPVLSHCGKSAPLDLEEIILQVGNDTGINPKLLATQIVIESGCNPKALGGVGEVGLMQIYPKYWPWSRSDLRNPEFNVWAGAQVLSKIYREGERSPQQVLKKYNGSPKYAVKVSDLYWKAFREPIVVESPDLSDLSLYVEAAARYSDQR
jgi:soluble lytic murein transglycosylase-like protein